MRVEVVASAEDLPTLVALVGAQTGVQAHVARQHVTSRENTVADFTQVQFRCFAGDPVLLGNHFRRKMTDHVLGQRVVRRQRIRTDGTVEWGGQVRG